MTGGPNGSQEDVPAPPPRILPRKGEEDRQAVGLFAAVENGGRRLIRIVDDGCGMLRDDADFTTGLSPTANYGKRQILYSRSDQQPLAGAVGDQVQFLVGAIEQMTDDR